ncbi:hypothetical protein [Accumulibacter sp.]|uniref:hypothetical protein n=1 Tax=Accumulibacter sp. TaxID=2053492 RepID=UPI0025ECF183|nr:hypothetical protein [Accumulibacter sp.]MCM8595542.1 hypothetical protein [Accumulibacter sp.]MCM8627286.1 hypothetical protein [Accumulibacter sp.]MDS4049689.1 hypothetical protein [Accumulibacter sp.]
MRISRRQFIRTGLAGSLLLSWAGWLNASGARPLTASEREMLLAVSDAMLEGALPTEGERRRRLLELTIDSIAVEVAGLPLATQKEIGELFGLLLVAPGRIVLAGIGKPWREASVGEVSEFLKSWRSSRLSLLQSAYAALHDLIYAAWYARPDTWDAIGYPGPPRGYF